MKRQIGIWVDASMWQAYRELCSRERLRPAEPIEKFIRFTVQGGSALTVMNMFDTINATKGHEAYARVLLNWYREGRRWIRVTGKDEAPVAFMLLQSLRTIIDPELRREIEEALVGKKPEESGEKIKNQTDDMLKRIDELRKLVGGE